MTGDRDERQRAVELPHPPRQLVAIQDGQVEVEQGEVGPERLRDLERDRSVVRELGAVTEQLERRLSA